MKEPKKTSGGGAAAICALIGMMLVSAGAGLIYRPAGVIVAGAFLIWLGLAGLKGAGGDEP